MRRFIIASIASAGVAAILVTTALAVINPDVNGSGKVDAADIAIVRAAFAQIVPTATPLPTIVGNRAFGNQYGGVLPYQLYDSDDGSIIKTFPVGDAPASGAAASCDGKYSMITTLVAGGLGFHIINTVDGSNIVEDLAAYLAPVVQFTCPLKGLGAKFNTVGPVANRAIAQGQTGSETHLRIFDLTTGETLYEVVAPAPNNSGIGVALSCAQNTVALSFPPNDALTIVRLSDGGVVTTISESGFRATC